MQEGMGADAELYVYSKILNAFLAYLDLNSSFNILSRITEKYTLTTAIIMYQ